MEARKNTLASRIMSAQEGEAGTNVEGEETPAEPKDDSKTEEEKKE